MKYNEIIKEVRALYPNEYTDEEMYGWIGEVNSEVRRNIEKKPPTHTKPTGTENTIIPSPYESIYKYYILAQISYYQKDFESYKKHIEQYFSKRNGYMSYYIRTYSGGSARFGNWI